MLQPVLLELLDRVVARALRLRRDDLVQELALAMLPAGLDVGPRHRDRLTEATSPLRGEDDHAGARRSLQDELPLLLCEIGPSRHRPSPFTLERPKRSRPRGSMALHA